MAAAIDFYFEYASPYSYLASQLIDRAARSVGREVRWRPIRLRDVWSRSGVAGDASEAKARYIAHDAARCARRLLLPFILPDPFPPDATLARLGFHGLELAAPDRAADFARAVAGATYRGADISSANTLATIAASVEIEGALLSAAWSDPEAPKRLEVVNAEAASIGLFGVPWFVADGESFFGHDRIEHMLEWLDQPR